MQNISTVHLHNTFISVVADVVNVLESTVLEAVHL